MSNEQQITIVGRLVEDPQLRFTGSGAAVVSFTIASNARKFDKQSNEWKDEPANFWRCNAWRDLAENIAESLTKGAAVIAQGEVKTRPWEDKEGNKRSSLEVEVSSVGPDLRWATAKPVKAQRGGGMAVTPTQGGFAPQQPAQDPWATGGGQGGWGNGDDGVPF